MYFEKIMLDDQLYGFLNSTAMLRLVSCHLNLRFSLLTDMEERTSAGSWASGSRSSKVTTNNNTTIDTFLNAHIYTNI